MRFKQDKRGLLRVSLYLRGPCCWNNKRRTTSSKDCAAVFPSLNLLRDLGPHREKITIEHEPRPQKLIWRTQPLRNLLLGDTAYGSNLLSRQKSDGSPVKSGWLDDFGAVCDLVDIGPEGTDEFVHWCHTTAASPEHIRDGVRIGSPFCANRKAAMNKMATPVLIFSAIEHGTSPRSAGRHTL